MLKNQKSSLFLHSIKNNFSQAVVGGGCVDAKHGNTYDVRMQNELSKKERRELRHREKNASRDRAVAKNKMKKIGVLLGIIFCAALVLGGIWYAVAHPAKLRTNREVALSCTTDMATQFHIHPRLSLSIKGVQQDVPANIGVKAGCMNPLHTHDASGTIHIESPEKRDFTVADFFAVWDKPFQKENMTVKMFVNGKENTELENYVMQDKDEIEIRYE